jgi:hypothetical protein
LQHRAGTRRQNCLVAGDVNCETDVGHILISIAVRDGTAGNAPFSALLYMKSPPQPVERIIGTLSILAAMHARNVSQSS